MPRLYSRLLLILMIAVPAAAQTLEEPGMEKTLSPFFFICSDDPSLDQMPLLSTTADIDIVGMIADVTVRQTYKNDGIRPIEAIYVFPASTRAAIYGMKMTIGDRVIVAEIREREQAREAYETAKQEGKSASLLEEQRPNVFQMNVANIMPGDLITVELCYTELLTPLDGVYEFVYPTVVGPRYSKKSATETPPSEHWVARPYQQEDETPLSDIDIRVRLATGLPIQEIVCPSHNTLTSFDDLDTATIELSPEEISGGNRDFILRYRLAGESIMTGILVAPGVDENFFLLMVQPPQQVEPENILPREYVFIMDVSGSMDGFPIETSKALLRNLIMQLRPVDFFNVIFFSSDNKMLSPQSMPATEENIKYALNQVQKKKGSGGTELLPALQSALTLSRSEGLSRTVVIATDGYVNVEPEAFNLVRNNLGNANFFTFGIGSSVNRHLLEGLAYVGMGEPFVITTPEESEAAAARFLRYIEAPVLTDVQVGFGTFEAYDIEPLTVPDVFAQRPVVIFGKWRGTAQGFITLTGLTATGLFQESMDVTEAIALSWGSSALRYLWARQRLKDLGDYSGLPVQGISNQSEDQISEVTQLGLKYNLLTQHTSFVAIDQVVRSDGQLARVVQPLPMPENVSNLAVGQVMVMTTASSVGSVSRSFEPEEIPLRDDRHWQETLLLFPGATLPDSTSIKPLLLHSGTGLHVDGQPRLNGAYKIDDIETGWEEGNVPSLVPGMDAVQEVFMFKGTQKAELGYPVSAVNNYSGSNRHHGSLNTFVGNDIGRAADYFSHLQPSARFGQLGFTLSGPIIKNKLFYAGSYQYTRDDQDQVHRLVLPTQAFRLGDFSEAPTTVYDPATGNPDGSDREPFSENLIPEDRVSPIAQRIMNLLPLPNLQDSAFGQVNYETTGRRTYRTHRMGVKVDWNISDRDRVAMSLNLARPKSKALNLFEDYGGPFNAGETGNSRQLAISTGIHYIRSWTPSILFESHLDWSHYGHNTLTPTLQPGLAGSIGIPGGDAGDIAIGMPSIVIEGYSAPLLGFADEVPRDVNQRFFHAGVVVTKVRGRHAFKTGVDIRRWRKSQFGVQNGVGPRGEFRFGPLQTADVNDMSSQTGLANAFAGFLLDAPDSIGRSLPVRAFGIRRSELSLFIEDDWKVSPKFTLNIGWRYEYDSAPVGLDSPGGLSNYDPVTNTLIVAGYGDIPENLGVKGSHHWLLPRVTASLMLGWKVRLHGGYGIQALPPVTTYYGTNFPVVQNDRNVKKDPFLPAGDMESGIPVIFNSEIPTSGLLEANSPGLLTQSYFNFPMEPLKNRLQTWNVGVDYRTYQFGFEAKYVGNRGNDIPVLRDLNAGTLLGAGDSGRMLFTEFGRNAPTFTWWPGRTVYDALQVSVRRYQGDLIRIIATYTLSRSLDYASENGLLSTPADPGRSWGYSDFDRRNAFASAFSINTNERTKLPERLKSVLKDWQFTGFFVAQSGTPIDITASNALLNAPGNLQRPDMISKPIVLGKIGPGQSYFDTSVFSMPAAAAWGNIGRNAVHGPGIIRLDMALIKGFKLADEANIGLRIECFNVTNTPQFVNPSGDFGSPTFGQITQTVFGSERSLRFGTRITF